MEDRQEAGPAASSLRRGYSRRRVPCPDAQQVGPCEKTPGLGRSAQSLPASDSEQSPGSGSPGSAERVAGPEATDSRFKFANPEAPGAKQGARAILAGVTLIYMCIKYIYIYIQTYTYIARRDKRLSPPRLLYSRRVLSLVRKLKAKPPLSLSASLDVL